MSSAIEQNCTFLIANDRTSGLQQEDICKDLESNEIESKIRGLKNAIFALLSNENMPRVLMTVIRFCITQDDHTLKKLLFLYWEIVPKYTTHTSSTQAQHSTSQTTTTTHTLLPEMILVCNALRNDLLSPNEYVRGCMLRFLCKIKEAELLEPLIPSVKICLEHRHSFVRRNAALAVFAIIRNFGDQLLPDGAELINAFIAAETDVSARRNAFLVLVHEAENLAIDFVSHHFEDISTYGDGFALLVLELARKVCRRDPQQKARFVRCLFTLLKSESLCVCYEAAHTLVSLSSAPTAVRAAAVAYSTVLNHTSSDVNVQLIVLDRLTELKEGHGGKVVAEVVMDVLRALASPSLRICEKALSVCVDLVSPRNLDEVVSLLRKEVVRAQESEVEQGGAYTALLVQALHRIAARFGEGVARTVCLSLCDLLGSVDQLQLQGATSTSTTSSTGTTGAAGSAKGEEQGGGPGGAIGVLQCVRALVEQYDTLRSPVLRKIVSSLDELTSSEALRVALWMCGEYSDTPAEDGEEVLLYEAFDSVRALLGEPPFHFTQDGIKAEKGGVIAGSSALSLTRNVVLSDGTYATVTSSATPEGVQGSAAEEVPHLRRLLCGGDVLLGTVACVALTKMALRALSHNNKAHNARTQQMVLGAALCAAGVGRLAESAALTQRAHTTTGSAAHNAATQHSDCVSRLTQCVRVLLDPSLRTHLAHTFTHACQSAYSALAQRQRAALKVPNLSQNTKGLSISRPDDLIQFRQLRSTGVGGALEVDLMDSDDISKSQNNGGFGDLGSFGKMKAGGSSQTPNNSVIQHMHQLTGYSDPVYVECNVTVHDYDIVLDMYLVNRTPQTLLNVTVELATIGDLRILDRPHALTLAPHGAQCVRASVKVSSTETAHIYGALSYETHSAPTQPGAAAVSVSSSQSQSAASQQAVQRVYLSLNDMQLDVMDYLRRPTSATPLSATEVHALCPPEAFRRMWAEFEWENKVAVNSNITDLYAFVRHVAESTHMTVLTPLSEGDDLSQSNFLAANLYARSVFGEDVLVNISVEKKIDTPALPQPAETNGETAAAAVAVVPTPAVPTGKLHGYIRIRSKTQGIALSLGDRITAIQRTHTNATAKSTAGEVAEMP